MRHGDVPVAAVCLRCDWSGNFDRVGMSDVRGASLPQRVEPHTIRRSCHDARGIQARGWTVRPPGARSRPRWIKVARSPADGVDRCGRRAVLRVRWGVVRHPASDPRVRPPSGAPLRHAGTLVYAVDDGFGRARLWRWDLVDGLVRRGPRVRQPIELVNAYGAEPGMVGVTSREPDGDQIGSLLRFLSPSRSCGAFGARRPW